MLRLHRTDFNNTLLVAFDDIAQISDLCFVIIPSLLLLLLLLINHKHLGKRRLASTTKI